MCKKALKIVMIAPALGSSHASQETGYANIEDELPGKRISSLYVSFLFRLLLLFLLRRHHSFLLFLEMSHDHQLLLVLAVATLLDIFQASKCARGRDGKESPENL